MDNINAGLKDCSYRKKELMKERKDGFKVSVMQSNFFKVVKPHFQRMGVILFNTIFGNIFIYCIIGLVNRVFAIFSKNGRHILSVFCFYSTNVRYLRTMVYTWYAPFVRWRPGFGRVQCQQGKIILCFGISSNEKDFCSKNKHKLKKLFDRMNLIKNIVGAETVTFAGVLPSVFAANAIMSSEDSIEAENTSKALMYQKSKCLY